MNLNILTLKESTNIKGNNLLSGCRREPINRETHQRRKRNKKLSY